jgi:cell division protease FtsH
MVYELGMSELGPVALTIPGSLVARDHSDEVSAQADREVRRILEEGDRHARTVLTVHRQVLEELAQQLIARETLERPDLQKLLGSLPPGLPQAMVPPGARRRSATSRS